MPTSYFVPFLLGGMILTGSSNSLWSKWQDMQCVENCDDPNPANHVLYEQPVWQTLQMFLGEMLCFFPVIYTWLKSRRTAYVQLPIDNDLAETPSKHAASLPLEGWKILLLWIPAACDLTGTTLMNVGLLYTPVSIYQMTRGALVLFVGVFSVVFLRRRLWLYQWVSLLVVMTGVGLVGFSGSLVKEAIKEPSIESIRAVLERSPLLSPIKTLEEPQPQVTKVLIGVFFILFAQIFTAFQFVIEESIMSRYSVAPLVAVGYEGLFGTISILLMFPILSLPEVANKSTFFDLPRGWNQMINSPAVLYSGIVIAFSIALFNYFGLSVTRHVSATARSLTDTCRTLSIWLISLGLGWEKFVVPVSLLQVLGFSFLVYGTFLFNNLVAPPPCLPGPPQEQDSHVSASSDEEQQGLLSSRLDETSALPADLGQGGFDVVPDGQHAVDPEQIHPHRHGKFKAVAT